MCVFSGLQNVIHPVHVVPDLLLKTVHPAILPLASMGRVAWPLVHRASLFLTVSVKVSVDSVLHLSEGSLLFCEIGV